MQTKTKTVSDILLTLGIPADVKGYDHLLYAIAETQKNPALLHAITKELYPTVGKHFNSTGSRAERAIRHALEIVYKNGRITRLNDIFGCDIYDFGAWPTNGEFIALLAKRCKP